MITIYGQKNCSFCTKAVQLCEQKNLEYVYLDLAVGNNKADMFKKVPHARTVPQIFIDDGLVGGFTELSNIVNI